jgi:hypothetical protein
MQEEITLIKTFMIDESPEAMIETKSKDKILVQFCGLQDEHFAARYSKVFKYQTFNKTKEEKGLPDFINEVHFWRSEEAKILMVSCSCIAKLRCKHIVRAYNLHKTALSAGFIQE